MRSARQGIHPALRPNQPPPLPIAVLAHAHDTHAPHTHDTHTTVSAHRWCVFEERDTEASSGTSTVGEKGRGERTGTSSTVGEAAGDVEVLEEHHLGAHLKLQLGGGGAMLQRVRPGGTARVRCPVPLP